MQFLYSLNKKHYTKNINRKNWLLRKIAMPFVEPHSVLLHFARQHLVLTLIQHATLRAHQEIHCAPPVIITFNNSCILRSAQQVSTDRHKVWKFLTFCKTDRTKIASCITWKTRSVKGNVGSPKQITVFTEQFIIFRIINIYLIILYSTVHIVRQGHTTYS